MRILDTDVCVEILRGNRDVIERRWLAGGPVATTWITAAELHYGAEKSIAPAKNQRLVEQLLATLEIHPLSQVAARHFGGLKADLEKQGMRLADADLFIAAITLSLGATLVTGNLRHYERIPTLALEDWIRPSGSAIHEPRTQYDAG